MSQSAEVSAAYYFAINGVEKEQVWLSGVTVNIYLRENSKSVLLSTRQSVERRSLDGSCNLQLSATNLVSSQVPRPIFGFLNQMLPQACSLHISLSSWQSRVSET
jgi:hypothetical protein